jgi:hypothetical protein
MSLEQDPLIVDIKAKINNEITRITEYLSYGKAADIEDYRKQTGKIIGYRASLIMIDDCIKNYMNDEDE